MKILTHLSSFLSFDCVHDEAKGGKLSSPLVGEGMGEGCFCTNTIKFVC